MWIVVTQGHRKNITPGARSTFLQVLRHLHGSLGQHCDGQLHQPSGQYDIFTVYYLCFIWLMLLSKVTCNWKRDTTQPTKTGFIGPWYISVKCSSLLKYVATFEVHHNTVDGVFLKFIMAFLIGKGHPHPYWFCKSPAWELPLVLDSCEVHNY